MPEARRAIQAGKLPRKAGLILVRHDQEYSLTLQAETLAVSGAKLPRLEEERDRSKDEARVDQVRHLIETIDLLYDAFGRRRMGSGWTKELGTGSQYGLVGWGNNEAESYTADPSNLNISGGALNIVARVQSHGTSVTSAKSGRPAGR